MRLGEPVQPKVEAITPMNAKHRTEDEFTIKQRTNPKNIITKYRETAYE